jgi:hypothetical protein
MMQKNRNRATMFAAIVICTLIIQTANALSDLTPVSGREEYCTKPVQAYLCDIAGVGVVVESQPTWFNIAVSNVWFGTATGNVMRIEVVDSSPPVTNAPIVFLAATNEFFKGEIFDSISYLCSWSFLTNRTVHSSVINNYTNAFTRWNLIGDQLSWFYVTEDNGATFAYVSNLVFKARVQQNHEAVYEYMRTQADTNAAPTRKIWIDARFTFINWACSGPNSFRHKMIDDPLLPFCIRKWGNFYLSEE